MLYNVVFAAKWQFITKAVLLLRTTTMSALFGHVVVRVNLQWGAFYSLDGDVGQVVGHQENAHRAKSLLIITMCDVIYVLSTAWTGC